jgi:hypothetical protein
MPLYFFDVRDTQGTRRDDTGLDFPDLDAAIADARQALADMTHEALLRKEDPQIEIAIRDHGDGPVRLVLSITTEYLEPSEEP